jgi:hypothetical protein
VDLPLRIWFWNDAAWNFISSSKKNHAYNEVGYLFRLVKTVKNAQGLWHLSRSENGYGKYWVTYSNSMHPKNLNGISRSTTGRKIEEFHNYT